MSEIRPFINQQVQILSTPLTLGPKGRKAIVNIIDNDPELTKAKRAGILRGVDKMVDNVNTAVREHHQQTLNKQGIHYVSTKCENIVAGYVATLEDEDVLDRYPLDPYVQLMSEKQSKNKDMEEDDEDNTNRDILGEVQSLPIEKLLDIIPLLPTERDASSVAGLSDSVKTRYLETLKRLNLACSTYNTTLHRSQALKELVCASMFLEHPQESIHPNLPVRRSALLDEMSRLRSLVSHIMALVERDPSGKTLEELRGILSKAEPENVEQQLNVLLGQTL
ncbi:hypothetical protein CJU90_6455 [Yarrowia sp. C11]|nr:hypothetical protein CJU90_6455 [Yarrowia sp. C11]KAG5371156.1 hypothetical protein CKK34_1296 [Yarrowia sp. E02]